MKHRETELVEICVDLVRETAMAILVDPGDGDEVWLPKSQIVDVETLPSIPANGVDIEIPEWLALDKDLI